MLSPEEIESIVDELRCDSRVIGVLLTGSYVYGTPNEQSDLDVRCVTGDGSDWAERDRMRHDIRIEIFSHPPEKIRWYMMQSKQEGHGACIHFWAHGKIVYDPTGIILLLQKEAKERWQEGAKNGLAWSVRAEKYKKYEKRDAL
jgi:predicted nucleotidyltransferase